MRQITSAARKSEPAFEPPIESLFVTEAEAVALSFNSPALELQRQLGEAALRGFYAPARNSRIVSVRRVVVAAMIGVASWGLVFAVGYAMIR